MFAVRSSEIRDMDKYMIERVGLPSLVLMENAAKSVVDVIQQDKQNLLKGGQVLIFCGTGNNGGDGLAIARWLIHQEVKVRCLVAGKVERLSDDSRKQLNWLNHLVESRGLEPVLFFEDMSQKELIDQIHTLAGEAELFIDALIGTGCERTLSERYCTLVNMMNKYRTKTISVDVPTGINADNGKVMGVCVQAHVTVTFGLPKLGLVLYPGANFVGQLIVSDIGLYGESIVASLDNPVELIDYQWFAAMKQKGVLERKQCSHKGTFGTLGVIAGDKHMLGATVLCAKAAYRTGAGLVKIFADEDMSGLLIQSIPEAIVIPYEKELSKDTFDSSVEEFLMTVDAVVIGPGLSKSLKARHLVQKILQMDVRVLLDADALNIISEHMEWFDERRCECIVTPHIGEMSRLTGYPSEGISENTIQFARAFAKDHKVTTVLKSARTVIVTDVEDIYLNMAGNSGLATAGSGDVLSGVIGALMAMGYQLQEATIIGVLLHSMASDVYATTYNKHTMVASDIVGNLWKGV